MEQGDQDQTQTNGTGTDNASTANQILQDGWTTQIDSQTAQQFTGLNQVRQARANQLQREAIALTKEYGANDPGVLAVQASLRNEQAFALKLGMARDTTTTTAPTAPNGGWVLYGRVRNADLTPAAQLTVFLADQGRTWLKTYAYAFTDQSGLFTLSYAPATVTGKARQKAAVEPLSVYVEVSDSACKLLYVDATPTAIANGAVVYRDIILSSDGPLGSPPCEPGTPTSTPPGRK
jgi:hypothetical protein